MRISKEKRIQKINSVKDEDIPELDEKFWSNAVIEYPEKKKPVLLIAES